MMIINWGDKDITVCNCCLVHKDEAEDRERWYHSGRVDYCPKCAKLLLEEFQTKLGKP